MNKEDIKSNRRENIVDWLVYIICSAVFTFPFFQGQELKHIGASLLIGFLFGILNRIIRILTIIKDKLN